MKQLLTEIVLQYNHKLKNDINNILVRTSKYNQSSTLNMVQLISLVLLKLLKLLWNHNMIVFYGSQIKTWKYVSLKLLVEWELLTNNWLEVINTFDIMAYAIKIIKLLAFDISFLFEGDQLLYR